MAFISVLMSSRGVVTSSRALLLPVVMKVFGAAVATFVGDSTADDPSTACSMPSEGCSTGGFGRDFFRDGPIE